jgi:probable HAF family extracellular repeat protein
MVTPIEVPFRECTLQDLCGRIVRCRRRGGRTAAGRAIRIAVLGVLLARGTVGSPGAAETYTVTDLNPSGALSSSGVDVNASGQVIITANYIENGGHAFFWQSGTFTDLGMLGQSPSATSINDAGQVVGTFTTGSPAMPHSFLWQNGVWQDLGTMGGAASRAIGINRYGQVVGQLLTSGTYAPRAFMWQSGVVQDLTQAASNFTFAHRISDAGWIIGDGYSPSHTYLWQAGLVTDLGTLGGDYSTSNAINAAGQIVGGSTTVPGASWPTSGHAFLYQGGVMTDLGLLPGADKSVANDISSSGQIVGSSSNIAFLYSGGVMRDLNALISVGSGWFLTSANGMNDYGQIVGTGYHSGSAQAHAFLLNPSAPAAPSGLSGSALSSSQVRLTWSDNSLIETAYVVWRKGGGADWTKIAALAANTTQFTDSGRTPATSYTYRVRAIGLGGASDWSNEATVLTPDNPPAAPTELTAQATSNVRVDLSWTDMSNNETAFAIWRRVGAGAWSRIGVTPPNAVSYADLSVSPGTSYTYRIRATNNYGASAWSNDAPVTTPSGS